MLVNYSWAGISFSNRLDAIKMCATDAHPSIIRMDGAAHAWSLRTTHIIGHTHSRTLLFCFVMGCLFEFYTFSSFFPFDLLLVRMWFAIWSVHMRLFYIILIRFMRWQLMKSHGRQPKTMATESMKLRQEAANKCASANSRIERNHAIGRENHRLNKCSLSKGNDQDWIQTDR